ncbi:uncharacterized protein LOC111613764 [Centruroides sculpturatus]|uniref:uncharacterized protein LOC111613764 n=1 Tax=Centruroides sculpturatus TaxID=218467 RepID=UPI000C6D5904|nr:uncharacterized protein LOC111613764 [Centruroides sculpturatus]
MLRKSFQSRCRLQVIRRFSEFDLSLEPKLKMENTFQDIRQFAGCDIGENQKLKILNFMKRFGKVSLCLTIGRFLIIDKRIPLKMAKTLHSVFSGFKKLKSISSEEQNCSQIYKINFTETN